MASVPDPLGSLTGPSRGPEPCPYCGATDCKAFPDTDVRPDYPLLPAAPPAADEAPRRRRGGRARHSPAETRHHPGPAEDR